MASLFKRLLPHALVLIGFVLVSLLYFSPVLQGKKIFQSDIMHYIGMAEQHKEFAKATGEETYWTNSAFGGMPTYQLGAKYPNNFIKKIDLTLRFLPRPADYLFLYFLGFYILLLALKVDFKLSALGALAFGFSTYLIIILGVGHNAKAHAIAYMPLVLAGIVLTFKRRYILGVLLTIFALGLEICANHPQMTYYLLFLVLILGIVYGVDAYKKQLLKPYFKAVGLLTFAAILALGLNATSLMATKSYAKVSTRGKSELTITPDGTPKKGTNGLSKAYITEYSYGLVEAFNLFIPRFMGGGNSEDIGKDSKTYKTYVNMGASPIEALELSKNAPMYWGKQPIVEAPAYVGAVIIFLFVLGLFLVKGRLKWWLVSGVVFSLLLSFGKNLNLLTDFFIDYVPLYNKFRAVSSIQVILELCIPVLGVFALKRLFNKDITDQEKLKALKYTVITTAGLCVLFLLFKSTFFDFKSFRDQGIPQPLVDALIDDRKSMFTIDTFRTMALVVLSAGILYGFITKKIHQNGVIITFTILLLFDLLTVNRKYVNTDNFVSATAVDKPYQPNSADISILEDKTHFRVLDLSTDGQRQPAKAAYFHNSLLGYHAAKIGRYNDILEFYIYNNNMNVINMLNTKYIIAEEKGRVFPYTNTDANGNAWFVTKLTVLENADAELKALEQLNTKLEAVTTVDLEVVESAFEVDTSAVITLNKVDPNHLKYTSENPKSGFAVFSEIYYGDGWNAYIDGELQPHYRVNYALRGLAIPSGKHIIEFKFEPTVVATGSTIALISAIIFGLLVLLGLGYTIKTKAY